MKKGLFYLPNAFARKHKLRPFITSRACLLTLVFNFCRNPKAHLENTKVHRKYTGVQFQRFSTSIEPVFFIIFNFPAIWHFDVTRLFGKVLMQVKYNLTSQYQKKNVQDKVQNVFLKTFIGLTSFSLSSINNLPSSIPLIILSSLWFTEPLKAIHTEGMVPLVDKYFL